MTVTLAQIWRHPIKAHGFEQLRRSAVHAGQTLPWDRTWAVIHSASKADGREWAHCANFSRGAKAPALMAIAATFDPAKMMLTLTHPDAQNLTFRPEDPQDAAAFIDWVAPLMPDERAPSTALVRARAQGMTDTAFPSISLGNLNTLRALSDHMGQELDPRRFRINLWIDGLEPWDEFEWIGRQVTIGAIPFTPEERITRCTSTMANPESGVRDADTLSALDEGWGHRDFGIALRAGGDGHLEIGDSVRVS